MSTSVLLLETTWVFFSRPPLADAESERDGESDMFDLHNLFEDHRFERFGNRKFFGEIESHKIGVVLATKDDRYGNCALNKKELDGVRRAKREGKLQEAYVVAAKKNGGGMTFLGQIDADELESKLVNVKTKSGAFGEFFVLPPELGFPVSDDPF
jgi:hypothetical protein